MRNARRLRRGTNSPSGCAQSTFIWHADATGTLMFEEILRAAERGVRVRLLLDDVNTCRIRPHAGAPGLESQPGAAPLQPVRRAWTRAGSGFLTDFTRVNHRMHNKSFTVDNLATDRRRPQHRRRVLRGRRRDRLRRPRRDGGRRRRAARFSAVRPLLEQRFGIPFTERSSPTSTLEPRDALAERARAIRASPELGTLWRNGDAVAGGARACSKARWLPNGRMPPWSFRRSCEDAGPRLRGGTADAAEAARRVRQAGPVRST